MTPYRSARIEGRALDPSRPKFGLAGAAAGAVACFYALFDLYRSTYTHIDDTLLFGGSAAIVLLVAYSALSAPAGRVFTLASVAVFAFSFVPQVAVHAWFGLWVFGVRYVGLAGIAAGLLLRLRRTRPGSTGLLLRAAAVMAAWWGLQWLVALAWSHANQSVRAELFSRFVYLFLAAGMLDLRRFVGGVPSQEPTRTSLHTASEIAATRLCLAFTSMGAALTALPYTWHSQWNVIASAEAVALLITLAFHVPWVARVRGVGPTLWIGFWSVIALVLCWQAYDRRTVYLVATVIAGLVAIITDGLVAASALSSKQEPEHRSALLLALGAAVVHFAWLVFVLVRV